MPDGIDIDIINAVRLSYGRAELYAAGLRRSRDPAKQQGKEEPVYDTKIDAIF